MPRLIDTVFETAGRTDARDARLNVNAFRGDARVEDFPDRLLLVVEPEKGHRERKLRALRLHDVAGRVRRRCRRETLDDALLGVDALDFEQGIGAI